MRLSEITEALPGTKKGFFSRIAQPFSNVKAALDFKIAIKKAYELWVEQAVPNLISRGLDMNDPTTYIRSFQTWLAPRLRLKNDHKILQDLVANLTRLGISKSTLTDQMSIALKAKSNLEPPTPGTPPTPGAPPQIQSGTRIPAGGVDYVWNGTEWRNSNNGQAATASIAAALTAQATGANP